MNFIKRFLSIKLTPCFFSQPADKKKFPYGGLNTARPVTPPRGAANQKNKGKK